MLDLQSRTLTAGQPWWRQPLLVFLRVALTLLLEGIVFFLFGYRQKRSWILFFLVNGLTQLFVNLLLLNFVGALGNLYSAKLAFWFLYLPMEILVILLELFLFCPMLKEKPLHHSGQPVQLAPGRRAAGLSAHLTGRRVSR